MLLLITHSAAQLSDFVTIYNSIEFLHSIVAIKIDEPIEMLRFRLNDLDWYNCAFRQSYQLKHFN